MAVWAVVAELGGEYCPQAFSGLVRGGGGFFFAKSKRRKENQKEFFIN